MSAVRQKEFKARVGDHVHMHSRKRLGAAREGEIIEVRGRPGAEYYLVQWKSGKQSSIHPGPGVTIPELDERARAAREARAEKEQPAPAEERAKPASAVPFELHKPVQSSLTAVAGDRLVIKSRHLDGAERDAEILEVLGPDGHPPYRVRWSDTGRESITRPGSDAYVDHLERKRS